MSNKRTGGRRNCKYYNACGSRDNCSRCNGFCAVGTAKRYEVVNQYGIKCGQSSNPGEVAYTPRDGSYSSCAKWCKRNDTASTCMIREVSK